MNSKSKSKVTLTKRKANVGPDWEIAIAARQYNCLNVIIVILFSLYSTAAWSNFAHNIVSSHFKSNVYFKSPTSDL